MKAFILLALLLTGCASQIQVATGYDTAAVVAARATADLNLKVVEQLYCSMTVDTLNRHPEAVEGVKAICWSNVKSTAADAAATLIIAK